MVISRIIPLVVFILLGVFGRQAGFIKRDTVDGLKWIIVNFLLPGVLFKSFLFARLELNLLLVAVSVFLSNLAMFGAGKAVSPLLTSGKRYVQFMTGGMEYGMLGLALLLSVWAWRNNLYINGGSWS